MKTKIFFLIVSLVFLTSCLSGDNSRNNAKIEREIYKGSTGVVLDTYQYKLPDEVYEEEQLNYVVKLENKGVYNVKTARLIVSLEKGFMEFSDGKNIYEEKFLNKVTILQGKTVFNTFNDFIVKEIPIQVKKLDALSEYHESAIQSLFCYDYAGIGFAEVCIDTDPHGVKPQDKSCELEESVSLAEGQGGPVVITRIEPRMLVENNYIKPQFKIYFQNQGEGTVINPNKIPDVCSNIALTRDTYNTIELVNIEFSNYEKNDFVCIPSELALRKEEDSITCTLKNGLPMESTNPFKTVLRIEIAYGYTESASKQIKILKAS